MENICSKSKMYICIYTRTWQTSLCIYFTLHAHLIKGGWKETRNMVEHVGEVVRNTFDYNLYAVRIPQRI